MKKKVTVLVGVFALLVWSGSAVAGDGHDHDHKDEKEHTAKKIEPKKKKSALKDHKHKEGEEDHHEGEEHKDEDGHDHKKEKKDGAGADHGHGHGEEEEVEAKNVGPEKGITSFDEEIGFKMSPEALKTFSVEKIVLNGSGPWKLPATTLLVTGEDKSVYRVRNETFKRIDVTVLSKNKDEAVVQSDDLKAGDSVVTKGVGDIRVAEVDVTSGESGHSH